ncbi:MAG: tRNA (adenosine(37)-N6)-dimethylallyltransferase MiaA [Bacteroidales bacterium]|nr:tRNA (adenosine(37)-N6)-dimethylallyltransferase MiaA [Bacteroidales bacterium]
MINGDDTPPDKTLIVIVGPTAVGKTSCSIRIAQMFDAEIVSADSRQFYSELNIGTAPPSEKELQLAKHHFIGHLSINKEYNVYRFETEALVIFEHLFKKSQYAVMVGGSGLYINAVCYGIDDLPDPDAVVRKELNQLLENEGIEPLREQLAGLDPQYFAVVDQENPKRLIRAIEVCLTTGKKYSDLRKNRSKPRRFNMIKIGLNRERNDLFEIINQRVDKMIENGLVEEVRSLYSYKHLNALNTVGYKEIFDYLDGKNDLERAIENIKTNTRRYAKRQLVWFKKDPTIKWFHPDETDEIINFINA